MQPETQKQPVIFLRRANISDYLEDQTVTINIVGVGSGVDTVENLLNGADMEAYECEIEGRRVVLLGFEPKS